MPACPTLEGRGENARGKSRPPGEKGNVRSAPFLGKKSLRHRPADDHALPWSKVCDELEGGGGKWSNKKNQSCPGQPWRGELGLDPTEEKKKKKGGRRKRDGGRPEPLEGVTLKKLPTKWERPFFCQRGAKGIGPLSGSFFGGGEKEGGGHVGGRKNCSLSGEAPEGMAPNRGFRRSGNEVKKGLGKLNISQKGKVVTGA